MDDIRKLGRNPDKELKQPIMSECNDLKPWDDFNFDVYCKLH